MSEAFAQCEGKVLRGDVSREGEGAGTEEGILEGLEYQSQDGMSAWRRGDACWCAVEEGGGGIS